MSRRIRVLRIIARMNVGGPAVQVCGLMRHLDASEFEQQLVTGFCAEDEADYLVTQAPDVLATRIRGLGRSISPVDDLRALLNIRRIIREWRPDVVHTHTAKAGVLGRVATFAVFPRPKLVHTFHGHLLHGYFGRLGTMIVVAIERSLGWFTDSLVAVGPEVRDDLVAARIGNARKFTVVEPGLELRAHPTRKEARLALDVPSDATVVSVLGRVTQIKRPDRMLDVIESVARQAPRLSVIVAGAGDLLQATQRVAEARALPIRFLGWREDVENVLAASDVTLLTSNNEGTPLSIIQAAMLGVPAVTTDVGSVRHIVHDGETGWVVAADAGALAAALISALQDRTECRRRGKAAQTWAVEHFSVERLAADYGRLYVRLVRS